MLMEPIIIAATTGSIPFQHAFADSGLRLTYGAATLRLTSLLPNTWPSMPLPSAMASALCQAPGTRLVEIALVLAAAEGGHEAVESPRARRIPLKSGGERGALAQRAPMTPGFLVEPKLLAELLSRCGPRPARQELFRGCP